jgi:long-subunit acyl-CoA synthetase (AMP-forming)
MLYAGANADYTVAVVVPSVSYLRHEHPELAEGVIESLLASSSMEQYVYCHAGGLEAIATRAKVVDVVQSEIARVAKAKALAKSEVPRRVVLSDREWTSENGLLTETLKVKRYAVSKAFKAKLDALYASGGGK